MKTRFLSLIIFSTLIVFFSKISAQTNIKIIENDQVLIDSVWGGQYSQTEIDSIVKIYIGSEGKSENSEIEIIVKTDTKKDMEEVETVTSSSCGNKNTKVVVIINDNGTVFENKNIESTEEKEITASGNAKQGTREITIEKKVIKEQ